MLRLLLVESLGQLWHVSAHFVLARIGDVYRTVLRSTVYASTALRYANSESGTTLTTLLTTSPQFKSHTRLVSEEQKCEDSILQSAHLQQPKQPRQV